MFGLLPFSVGPWELILVLAIVLIIVGPGKLPSVGRSIGKALGEFRKSKSEYDEDETTEDPAKSAKKLN
jgi:sec-independent protein translocase protein TatA